MIAVDPEYLASLALLADSQRQYAAQIRSWDELPPLLAEHLSILTTRIGFQAYCLRRLVPEHMYIKVAAEFNRNGRLQALAVGREVDGGTAELRDAVRSALCRVDALSQDDRFNEIVELVVDEVSRRTGRVA